MDTITISASRLDEAYERIAKANRRLARNGIEERFELEVGPEVIKAVGPFDPQGCITVHTQFEAKVDISLNTPEISYGGWTFIATLVDETGDLITRVAPGQDLGGYAPKEAVCDHCGIVRQRNETYIVRNEEGEIKQVGSSCIRLFLGVQPSLWALTYDLSDLADDNDRDGGYVRTERIYQVRTLIAVAHVITEGGRGYRNRNHFDGSTAGEVQSFLHPSFSFLSPTEAAELRAKNAAIAAGVEALPASEVDAVIAAVNDLDEVTDYGRNMRILVGKEFVGAKSFGYVVSAVAVYAKATGAAAERAAKALAAPKATGYVAPVGAKLKGIQAVVTMVKPLAENQWGGTPYLVTLTAKETGQTIKWFASSRPSVNELDEVTFAGGTVKAHDTFRGEDQTMVTRVKFA
jgi:hypothetical protein